MLCCKTPETSKTQDEMILEGKEIKTTLVISLAFQLVFTAFNALQNLHSSLHDEHSLGLICLSTIYFTAIVSSIFSPTIIGLMGAKNVLVVYFLAHCVYVTVSFYPSFATMVPAAVCVGAFHGSAWSTQALYVSANAYSYSKRPSVQNPYDILTRFNLFFFATFATTQIGGNLVASAILGSSRGNSSDAGAALQHCGINDCPHLTNITELQDPEDWAIYTLRGVFLGCTVGGLLLVLVMLPPLPRSDWLKKSVGVRSNITSCFSVLATSDMLLLVPLILFTSIQQAFLVGTYTESYVACALGIHMVGFVMAAYGATTPVFAFIIGRLSRFTGRFLLVTASMGVHIVLLAVLLHWSPDEEDIVTLFIVPAIWGVAESVLLAQANSLIFALNVSQKEPAFANYQAWRSLGYFVTFLNLTYLCVSIKLILCLTCAALGLVLYIVVEFRTQFRERTVFEKHDSMASISPSHGSIRADDVSGTSSERSNVASPLMTTADQNIFHRRELYDVIREAQTGWRRNSRAGFTLDISRLSARVTRGPNAVDITSLFRSSGANAAVTRSLSDGHLQTISDGPEPRLVAEPCSATEYSYKELPGNDPDEKKSAVVGNNFLSTSDDESFRKSIFAGQCAVKQSSDDHLDMVPRARNKSIIQLLSESLQKLNVDNGEPNLTDFEYTVLSPLGPSELNSASGDMEHDETYTSQDDPDSTTQPQGGKRWSRNRPGSLQREQPLSFDQGYMSEEKEQEAAGRFSTQLSEPCDTVRLRSSPAASGSASIKKKKTLSFISLNSFRRSKKMRKVGANDESARRSGGVSRRDSEGFFPDDDFGVQNSFPEYTLNVRPPRGQGKAQDDSISIY